MVSIAAFQQEGSVFELGLRPFCVKFSGFPYGSKTCTLPISMSMRANVCVTCGLVTCSGSPASC